MKRAISILAIALVVLSCKKDNNFGPQYSEDAPTQIEKVLNGVLVLNEGNFGFGNSSLSVIDFKTQQIQNKVFEGANQKKLGDVAQSILVVDSLAFIAVNNSNSIFVVGITDFKQIKEIKVTGAPRYLVRYKNEILVSTMGANALFSISLSDYSLTKKVSLSNWGWLEEMQIQGDKLYACNRTKNKIDLVNLETNQLESQIIVGKDPESIVADSSGDVWVLCTGGFDKNDREKASIYKIRESSSTLMFRFADIENSPTRLRMSKSGDKLYFINNGLYQFSLNSIGEPVSILAQSSGQVFYGLGINPANGNLFLTNAKDYQSSGEILELDGNASVIQKFNTGFIPQAMGFY